MYYVTFIQALCFACNDDDYDDDYDDDTVINNKIVIKINK